MHTTRPAFTHSSILKQVNMSLKQSTQHLDQAGSISLSDCFMSGVAIFSLKYDSLLQFEKDRTSEFFIRHNLSSLYGIERVPCDTYLRERLDGQDLSIIRTAFKDLFTLTQRNKVLEEWKFLDNKFIISLDASGFFSSTEIKCEYCCTRVHNRGTDKESTTYHHQMLVGSIVSPSCKQVIPIEFEPIIKEDGEQKNDCERNCAKRWLELFRRSHPQLPTIIVADGLYSNAPFIQELQENRCSFILVAKEDDHKYLYDYFWAGAGEDICEFEHILHDKKYKYRFMNNVPLNDSNYDLKVNVLYFEEHDLKNNKVTKWLWVTDIKITKDNAQRIMKGGRSRWKIENETFNTLKNQGYNFEHNFGHGYKGLSNVFAGLMLFAFYVDQILEAVNFEFQAMRKKYGSRYNCFEKIRGLFFTFKISSFERIYEVLLGPPIERLL